MLIESFEMEVFSPPCSPGAERYVAKVRLAADISEVLPYLKATLPGAVYYPQARALTWQKDGHGIALHPFEIAIGDLEDRQEAQGVVQEVVALVNRTWERRAEITPDTTAQPRLTHLTVFKLLPQSNCKQCGEPTCYTFALKLTAFQRKPGDCPPLSQPQYADNLAVLERMIAAAKP